MRAGQKHMPAGPQSSSPAYPSALGRPVPLRMAIARFFCYVEAIVNSERGCAMRALLWFPLLRLGFFNPVSTAYSTTRTVTARRALRPPSGR
ncbi:MAG: hypothetical protein ACLGJC_03160 [Alphaproteobacteria bacterium]